MVQGPGRTWKGILTTAARGELPSAPLPEWVTRDPSTPEKGRSPTSFYAQDDNPELPYGVPYNCRYTLAFRMIACTYSRVSVNGIDSTNS